MIFGVIGIIIKQGDKHQYLDNVMVFQDKYDAHVNRLGIVKSDIQATLIDMNDYHTEVLIQQYLWIKNETLHIFPTPKYYVEYCTSSTTVPDVAKLKLRSIPIDSISYYEEVGELDEYEETYQQEVRVYNPVTDMIEPEERIKTKVVVEDSCEVELVYERLSDDKKKTKGSLYKEKK